MCIRLAAVPSSSQTNIDRIRSYRLSYKSPTSSQPRIYSQAVRVPKNPAVGRVFWIERGVSGLACRKTGWPELEVWHVVPFRSQCAMQLDLGGRCSCLAVEASPIIHVNPAQTKNRLLFEWQAETVPLPAAGR